MSRSVCWRTAQGFVTVLHLRRGHRTACGRRIGRPAWVHWLQALDMHHRPALPSTQGTAFHCRRCFPHA